MRRLVLSVFTLCGFAILTACSSGGGFGFASGNGNGSIDQIVFSNGSAQANNFFVTPGGTAPLQISAVGQKGSGPSATIVPDAVFTWAGRFVDPATDTDPHVLNYTTGTSPNGSKPCPAKPASTPAVPILQQVTPVPAVTATNPRPGYISLPATQAANVVFIDAVPGVTPPYCLVIQATHAGDGVIGSTTVIVSNSP